MQRFRTGYMDQAVFELPSVIEAAQKALKGVDFDTMVGTGLSGSIVIPALALAMGKKFVLIRKQTDDSHHGRGRMVGELGERWLFVDDFVSSGATRSRVIRKISADPSPSVLVGQYLYSKYFADEIPAFEPVQEAWIPKGLL